MTDGKCITAEIEMNAGWRKTLSQEKNTILGTIKINRGLHPDNHIQTFDLVFNGFYVTLTEKSHFLPASGWFEFDEAREKLRQRWRQVCKACSLETCPPGQKRHSEFTTKDDKNADG